MLMGNGLGSAITKDGNPLALHYVMFLPALISQASQEQMAYWIGRAWAGQIIGTYAQTELGHGSFLRGLETTATYDPDSEEFVLHSPTITSIKWWPGGLGKTANHAVVMAQLYTEGKCWGPHAFIVQLRDLDTHASLPGISVGEIGPRLGTNSQDNGFLRLHHVRIPRLHMLMQHAQVTKSGEYVQPASSKLTYGTMVFVRVAICFDAGRQLQRAVTIATRYSAVRRQSELVPGEGEVQVLDYQTQQHKLLPQLATVFAVTFSARRLWETYNSVTHGPKEAQLALLPELHVLSCGLKAACASDCSLGCDVCRLACGGHGYLASSNLPRIVTATTATQTYEGENTVMWLQVARYVTFSSAIYRTASMVQVLSCLFQQLAQVARTYLYLLKVYSDGLESGEEAGPSVQFLREPRPDLTAPSHARLTNYGLVMGWRVAVVALLQEAQQELQRRVAAGQQPDRARDACSLTLVDAAQCYIRGHMCCQFVAGVDELQGLSAGTTLVLQQLCRLYLLYHASSSHLLRHGWLSGADVSQLEAEYRALLTELRQDAVAL
ncbi:hypothetical protein HAZT_HAZT004737, partial [Hyalella azteca]